MTNNEQSQTEPSTTPEGRNIIPGDFLTERNVERMKGKPKRKSNFKPKKKKKYDTTGKQAYTYILRLAPLKNYRVLIEKTLAAATFYYNFFLARLKQYHEGEKVGKYHETNLITDVIQWKPWLGEQISKEVGVNVLIHLNCFWDNAQGVYGDKGWSYKGKLTRRKRNVFRLDTEVYIEGNRLYMPNFPEGIRFKGKKPNKPIDGCTIVKKNGTYYAHVYVAKKTDSVPEPEFFAAGIDVGINPSAAISDGRRIENPLKQTEVKPKWHPLKKIIKRKEKASNRFRKVSRRMGRIKSHGRTMQRGRLDAAVRHEVGQFQALCMESLNVKFIRHTPGSGEARIGELNMMFDFKAARAGRQVIRCSRGFASSQICHVCGHRNRNLKREQKTWVCPCCKTTLDRDYNASVNLLFEGLPVIATTALIQRHREVPHYRVPMKEVIRLGKGPQGQTVWGLAANGLEAEIASASQVGLLLFSDPEHVSIAA